MLQHINLEEELFMDDASKGTGNKSESESRLFVN